jgi:hypothetical protein
MKVMEADKKLLAIFATQKVTEKQADTINSLSADTIKKLSADTINSLSAYTINSLSADTIKKLSAYTINSLSADTLKALGDIKTLVNALPVLENPYSKMWDDLETKRRVHNQTNWGPEECPAEENICGTQMCTAGHLVNMSGSAGYALKEKVGWANAASFIHQKSTSAQLPEQNYGSIPQAWALAFIEENARMEKEEK